MLVPTRNRASIAARAVSSFLAGIADLAKASVVRICVVDDSDDGAESTELARHLDVLAQAHPAIWFELVRHVPAPRSGDLSAFGGGPGAARNAGLRHLRTLPLDHDVLMMFDDDICFAGVILLDEALTLCGQGRNVVGCDYEGRQDLSILEHARLDAGDGSADGALSPSSVRDDVENVAPGGISTAFLTVSAPAHDLPDFPEHYNEDYLWLHRLANQGWSLRKTSERLLHAPPGDVAVTAPGLSYQLFGEIVWLAVLEATKFPVDDRLAMAAAVEEIAGDLRSALAGGRVGADPSLAATVGHVLRRFESIRDDIGAGRASERADALMAAIRLGLEYCGVERGG